jgi:hypothetical protein
MTNRCAERSSRWAPWWLYVVVAFPSNWAVQQGLPGDTDWWFRAVLTAAIVAASIAVLTAIYRWGWGD